MASENDVQEALKYDKKELGKRYVEVFASTAAEWQEVRIREKDSAVQVEYVSAVILWCIDFESFD